MLLHKTSELTFHHGGDVEIEWTTRTIYNPTGESELFEKGDFWGAKE